MTIGLMFAVGVFATYSALGLGALGALRVLNRFELAGKVITGLSIAALIALSILSIRDAYLLQSGRMDRVVLQLPDPLKDRLRQRIRTQRRVGFVGAGAFTLGAAISMFEVVCTGQVYLPTLAYLAQRGNAEAVATLVIYNVAFIVPLLIVLAVVAAGAESNLISRLIKKHAALAKLAVTAAFMALAIVLLQELI
jgi:cytochrome c biogenesis protein CcdA